MDSVVDNLNQTKPAKTAKPVKKGRFGLSPLRILTILIVLSALAAGGYLWVRYTEAQQEIKRLSNPQEAAQEETRQLTAKVGMLVDIPANETPTIATVNDAAKLKSQAFFAKAENGDKVLIFTQAKRAVLYRPSTNKVLEIAPVNLGNNETTQQNQQQTQQPSQ